MKSGLVVIAVAAAVAAATPRAPRAAAAEPSLSDQEFRTLITGLSERGGTFVTDNIVSNEIAQQDVLPELERTHHGAYIGVGPEQNLTYVSALRPSIAFIVDLQRGNMLLHLMYKALVETSSDRADFCPVCSRGRVPRGSRPTRPRRRCSARTRRCRGRRRSRGRS